MAATPDIRKAYRRWQYDIMLDKLDEERRLAKIAEQFAQSEARGKAEDKAEGIAEGKAERDMEIALKVFASETKRGRSMNDIIEILRDYSITEKVIEAVINANK